MMEAGMTSEPGRPGEPGKHCDRIPSTLLGNDVPLMAANMEAILASPSYVLADDDHELLELEGMRGVRMMLELQKPEIALQNEKIGSTVIVFGGTQIVERGAAERRLADARRAASAAPADASLAREVARSQRLLELSHFYDEAREFARLVSIDHQCENRREFVVVTGGGPGIMEAANRGAFDVGCKSIGLNIRLPAEQQPNPFITPELCFQFRYFAIRKFHFILRAAGVVLFPGGFGTLDELFEALTLRQTHRMQPAPIVLYGRDYWKGVVDFRKLADNGVISDAHLDLFTYADTPEAAWRTIVDFHERQKKADHPHQRPGQDESDELNA
jgi:uncharacterized protein (TIGR00730 family)